MSDWLLAAPWFVVLGIVLRRYATRSVQLSHYPAIPDGPRVSVIVPARNESANIERCLRSILGGRYDPLEIIVVDDRSTDDTAAIVQRLIAEVGNPGRLRLVRGADLPEGWFGKSWAIVQGYRAATGALLLFADADTVHSPELISRAVCGLAAERVDLFTVLPQQEMVTFWERLVQPHVFFALQSRIGNVRIVNRTRTQWNAIANGQFILTTRSAYEAVGTHAAVRLTVAEDMALAQAYVQAGRDIFLVHAEDFMLTRMYRSLGEIVAGWSKNLAVAAPQMMPPYRLARRLLPYVMWLPALAWVGPPITWLVWRWPWLLAAIGASLLMWVEVYRRERAPTRYALLYPAGAALVAFIMVRSAWRGSRRIEWRGRVYGTASLPPHNSESSAAL